MNGLVIPCYNEEHRLPADQITALLRANPDLRVLLVNDGSKDRTEDVLRRLAATDPRLAVLSLERNRGKAEAVRRGLVQLTTEGCAWVGYADADFATPAPELTRLNELTADTKADALLGSRVRLLGTDIERKVVRHYLGRVFATLASLALELPVYDTQCGAKFFRNTAEFRACVTESFGSRWAFDIELIGRLNLRRPHFTHGTFLEVPLHTWHDVGGSKLGWSAMIKAGLDVLKIGWRLRRARVSRTSV